MFRYYPAMDTENEIIQLEKEAKHLEKTPLSLQTARLDHIRAEHKWNGIKKRKEFIKKLKGILKYRKENEK